MPTNHYSLQNQIVNFFSKKIDFDSFLDSNPSAKVYYSDLDEEQKKQYIEDFLYLSNLVMCSIDFLKKVKLPAHQLM